MCQSNRPDVTVPFAFCFLERLFQCAVACNDFALAGIRRSMPRVSIWHRPVIEMRVGVKSPLGPTGLLCAVDNLQRWWCRRVGGARPCRKNGVSPKDNRHESRVPFNGDVQLSGRCGRWSRGIRFARLIGYPRSAGGRSHVSVVALCTSRVNRRWNFVDGFMYRSTDPSCILRESGSLNPFRQ